MLSQGDQQDLIDLAEKFKNSGDDITLVHLLDLVQAKIPNNDSQEAKDWCRYMDCVNQAWVSIHKENELVPWPEVSISMFSFMIGT